jgi:hypothetical protein
VRKASILAQDVVFQKKPPLPPSPPARVMRPAPVLKLLGSPVFQGGRGRAATFGGKNGKLRSFTPDRTARRSCSRMRWRAAARQTGLKIGGVRPGRDDPLVKIDPPRDPPFLTSRRSHPCIGPCVSLSFLTTRYGSQDQPTKEGLGVKASDEKRVDKLQGVTRPARSQTAAGRLWRRRRPDASIQNDSGPPQGPATGSVVG